MSNSSDKNNSELQKAYTEEEQQVAEQTAELREVNTLLRREITERKKAEEESANARYLQQLMLDHIPGVVLLLRKPTREVVAANQAGIDVGAVVGSKCFETWGQSQVPCPWCLASDLWATGEEHHAVIEADKKVFEAHWVPVSDDLYLHYALDITERKRSEEKLQEKDQLIQQAMSISNSFTFEWDVATDQVQRSASCEKVFRIDSGDMCIATAKRFFEAIHPDDRPQLEALLRNLTPAADTYITDFRLVLSDGSVVTLEETAQAFFDASGKMERIIGVATDITKRKETEDALHESQQRLRRFYDSSLLGVMYWNMDGRIIDANDKFLEMVGYTREDLTAGRIDWENITPAEYSHLDEAAINEVRAKGVNEKPYEKEYIRKDGSRIPILIAGAILDEARCNGAAFVLDITERKQAEEALQTALDHLETKVQERTAELESAMEAVGTERQRLYDVLETLPAMICLLTADYHVAFANRSFREKFGESHGRHCYDYCFDRAEPCEFCESYNVLKTGKPHRWEVTSPDGSAIIDAYDFPFTDVDGTPMILEMDIDITEQRKAEAELVRYRNHLEEMVKDRTTQLEAEITERKKIEEAMRESEERLRLAQAVARVGTFEWNVITDVNVWTPELEAMYGLPPGGFARSQSAWEDLVHSEDRAKAVRLVEQAFETGEPTEAEFRVIWPDDSVHWLAGRWQAIRDEAGKPLRLIGVNIDITDSKQAEEALRESEGRFRTMVNAIPQLAWMANADGFIFWYNQRWFEYTGTTPEQMEGWGWQSVHDPEKLPKVLEQWKSSLATGEPFDMEFPLLGADGRFRPFLTRVLPLKDPEGRVVRWFGTNTDVSEMRELEAHKRDFYRRTILAATNGKLEIVELEGMPTPRGELVRTWKFATMKDYSLALAQSFKAAENLGLKAELLNRFKACSGEMLNNALKHAGSGVASLYKTDDGVSFAVSDTGPGIASLNLPDVALVHGYSTVGTGGLGYKLIIGCADKTYLATGSSGTKVVVEIKV